MILSMSTIWIYYTWLILIPPSNVVFRILCWYQSIWKNNTYVPYILTFAPQITSGNAPGKTKSIENLADLKFWSPNEWYFATKTTYVFWGTGCKRMSLSLSENNELNWNTKKLRKDVDIRNNYTVHAKS